MCVCVLETKTNSRSTRTKTDGRVCVCVCVAAQASELTIVVMGASGDLARKKTYPALFGLYKLGLLPQHTTVIGYARTELKPDEFKKRISASFASDAKAGDFLKLCLYMNGSVSAPLVVAVLLIAARSVVAVRRRRCVQASGVARARV